MTKSSQTPARPTRHAHGTAWLFSRLLDRDEDFEDEEEVDDESDDVLDDEDEPAEAPVTDK
jgi:hypothetical protein